jgi:hypothetical protein
MYKVVVSSQIFLDILTLNIATMTVAIAREATSIASCSVVITGTCIIVISLFYCF